jgi:hypothetical protein
MQQVSDDYFTPETMGCYAPFKYTANSTNYYNLPCDSKAEISLVWEGQGGKMVED